MTKAARLLREVREVLLADWDPIGVRDIPQARDEYDEYATTIAQLLRAGASPAELASHLVEIEVNSMGLKGNSERATLAATRLWKSWSNLSGEGAR